MDPRHLVLKGLEYVALLLALTVHEFSHALVANVLGDDTAKDEGRLTLNPLAHVDPIGTVVLPLLGLFTAMPMFGWAKPVPVQAGNFRRGWYGRGQVAVAAAGPGSNLLQATFWLAVHAVLTRLVPLEDSFGTPLQFLALFVESSFLINLLLAAFNVIPIWPLDGSHVASWGLPRRMGDAYDDLMRRAGPILFLALFLPILGGGSLAGLVLSPVWAAGAAIQDLLSGWRMTMTNYVWILEHAP